MPYPQEHACRLRSPDEFQKDSFKRTKRKHDGREYSIIMGRLKGETTMTEQAYRYPRDTWTVDQARSHCKSHDGKTFEPAEESKAREMIRPIYEFRSIPAALKFEEREEKPPVVSGYWIVWDKWSEDLGGFRERFMPGSVTETIKEDDLRAVYNHNNDWILGRISSGTLRVGEDEKGAFYEADIPLEAQWAKDAVVSLKRGDVRENSFVFASRPEDEKWEEKDGILHRTVLKASIREMGPQAFPAYPQTNAEVRSLIETVEYGCRIIAARRHIDPDVLMRKLNLD